ncbi:MAG: ABC transporter ATP-binding protein [Euryarchaeota archaeon]|nr:ABC transporter ATP-binding protein [Euryarchaeota archaeon]
MDKKEVILKVKNLRKKYGEEEVVKGISFTLQKGEIFSMVGPNGAGKTTTIKAILGLTHRYAGEIKITAGKINYLAENEIPYPAMDVYEYMRFYADILNVTDEKIKELLDLVELTSHISKKCKNLSKGMKQRLLIARTFLNEPELLILDEPFSGVDPEMRARLLNFMRDYVTRTKAAILLTTHILGDVEKLSHRVAIIRDGKIISMGEVGDLGASTSGDREIRLKIVKKEQTREAIHNLKEVPGVKDVVIETEDIIRCMYSSEVSEYTILSKLFSDKIEFRIISGDVESAFMGESR